MRLFLFQVITSATPIGFQREVFFLKFEMTQSEMVNKFSFTMYLIRIALMVFLFQ